MSSHCLRSTRIVELYAFPEPVPLRFFTAIGIFLTLVSIGLAIPVIITDSFGRPWREGLTEFAIGVSGMKPLRDDRTWTITQLVYANNDIKSMLTMIASMVGASVPGLVSLPVGET